jgi:glycosyltransferase involved in cell wall biosynthesis
MKVSVIVPTYNRPGALRLCLMSLAEQTWLPDEVLIADDGSGDETRRCIEAFAGSKACSFELRHIWQEDDGFRKPKIINETVRNSVGDYLVFIDGDCMAHQDYIRSHLLLAEPEAMLGGKRVEIGRTLSEKAIREGKVLNSITLGLIMDSIEHGSRKVEEAVRIENGLLRTLFHKDRISDDGIWGCNFSVHRALFYAINGCDEDFTDGSVEDNDLGIRVLNRGGKIKSVRALAIVFHLCHDPSWSAGNEKHLHNMRILEKRKALKQSQCLNGICKLG